MRTEKMRDIIERRETSKRKTLKWMKKRLEWMGLFPYREKGIRLRIE